MTKIFLLLFIFLTLTSVNIPANSTTINVLIWSGKNNHDWRSTTQEIYGTLSKYPHFNVKVINNPEKFNTNDFDKYDVIISNWCNWPNVKGLRWNSELEEAFLNFISSGKGILFIHAASASHYDWPEFHKIVGGRWELGVTGHGPIHTFKVSINDKQHPITKDLEPFYINDELWHKTKFQSDIKKLCKAYSSSDYKGTNSFEPILVTSNYGKGRSLYLLLGHDKFAMKNNAWKTLLLRGTEWTAGKEIKVPIQTPWPATKEIAENQSIWSFTNTDSVISLLRYDEPVWQFNIPKIGKPYFHPLNTFDKQALTWIKPDDHPWHYGLWFSWKYINGVNYWEEDLITGQSDGITKVHSFETILDKDNSVKINMELEYYENDNWVQLYENRVIEISSPDESGNYFIDWNAKFRAGQHSVELERTPIEGQVGGKPWGGYATLGYRFNSINYELVSITNDQGNKNNAIHSKPTKWVDISGMQINDSLKIAGLAIFDNPNNLRHPSPGYIINDPINDSKDRFIYTNPGLLYERGLTLKPGEAISLNYRIYIHSGALSNKELNQIYYDYVK